MSVRIQILRGVAQAKSRGRLAGTLVPSRSAKRSPSVTLNKTTGGVGLIVDNAILTLNSFSKKDRPSSYCNGSQRATFGSGQAFN